MVLLTKTGHGKLLTDPTENLIECVTIHIYMKNNPCKWWNALENWCLSTKNQSILLL